MATALSRRRRWDELGKDLLVTIFSNLEVTDLLAGASHTCSSWRSASKDPVLWRVKSLDFRRFQSSFLSPCAFPGVLRVAIARVGGCLEKIWFPCFADHSDLLYVAERCPKLCYFYMDNSDEPEYDFFEAICKLRFLKGMTVNEELIDDEVLELVAKSCAHFSELEVIAEAFDRCMASVICTALPRLRKLELKVCLLLSVALHMLLDDLKELEYLDISGQKLPGITSVVLEKASHLKVFLWDSDIDNCNLAVV